MDKMSSTIRFKFNYIKGDYEIVSFSGMEIRLLELKRKIVEMKNFAKCLYNFDLQIINDQTEEGILFSCLCSV